MSDTRFDYYYGAEGDQFSFIRIPKLMLLDPKFAELSLGAIVLYGLLLDRMNNSVKHGWLDENNHVYIRYKIKDIQATLNLSENTATKYLGELEKIGLVEKVKVGLGQGNVLFVKNFISADLRDKAFITTKNCGNGETDYYSKKLGRPKNTANTSNSGPQKPSKINITAKNGTYGAPDIGGNGAAESGGYEAADFTEQNKNENRNKYINNTQSNLSSADMYLNLYKRRVTRIIDQDRIDEIDDSMIFRTGLKEQIEYENLCNDQPDDTGMIDEIVETMVEMMVCTAPTQQISGNDYSSELVKQRVMKIYRKHVEYMLECLKKNTSKISSIKAYLRATIFNAQSTINSYYKTGENHRKQASDAEESVKYNGYSYDELENILISN